MKLKDLVSFEHSLWKIVTGIVGGIVLLVALGIWALFLFKPSLKTLLFPPDIPESADVSRVVWLDQNWSEHDRYWFHHVTQGTSTIPMPYDWFVSLEAPELLIFSNPPLLSDPAFLSRLGFISSPRTWETDSYGYNRDKIDYDENDKYNWKNYSGNIDGLPVANTRCRALFR